MMTHSDAPALPLWINGRVFLIAAHDFLDVRDAASGEVLRQVPRCGADEAAAAAASARAALPGWSATPAAERRAALIRLADALDAYADHFAGIVAAETGHDPVAVRTEVASAIAALRRAEAQGPARVVAVVSDAAAPLQSPVSLVAPALAAGCAVVMRPGPEAPSAAFAFAELTARAGLPGGVVNLVHGDAVAVAALCAEPGIDLVAFAGEPTAGEAVSAQAARAGKPCFAAAAATWPMRLSAA